MRAANMSPNFLLICGFGNRRKSSRMKCARLLVRRDFIQRRPARMNQDALEEGRERLRTGSAALVIIRPGIWPTISRTSSRISGQLRHQLPRSGRLTTQSRRWIEEFGAKLIRDFPGRFGMFAAIPLSDVDGIRSTGGHQCRLDDRARLGHGIRDWRHRRHADRAHRVPRAQHVGACCSMVSPRRRCGRETGRPVPREVSCRLWTNAQVGGAAPPTDEPKRRGAGRFVVAVLLYFSRYSSGN
jgi:hypothetical protein